MNPKEEKGVFELIDGLTEVDPRALEEFKRAMAQEIEEIVKVVEERRVCAAESRRWQLKC